MSTTGPKEVLQLDDDSGILARTLHILRVVTQSAEPLANRDLAAITGIPKATVSRITTRLLQAGLLRQVRHTELFALGAGVLELSRAFLDKIDVRAEFRRVVPPIVEEIGGAAHIGIRDRFDMVLLDTVQPRAATLTTRLRAGSRLSLATSAIGRAYLCALTEEERQAQCQTLVRHDQAKAGELAQQLQRAATELQTTGFCNSFGEWYPDIHAVATYLLAPDGDIYAISCGGPASRLPASYLSEQAIPRLRDVVRAICAETGAISAFT
ncbi:MAG: IclR family transcriptional regulator [Pigmentiphaga sp.]|nr:IclR family transcriptional regulator [Pigmentiphaga sp.]